VNFNEMQNFWTRLSSVDVRHGEEDEAVVSTVRAYFAELVVVEETGARLDEADELGPDDFNSLIAQKRKIYDKYWINKSDFYVPSSVASFVDHDWTRVVSHWVLRNGDSDCPMFLFFYLYRDSVSDELVPRCLLLRQHAGRTMIEHSFHQ
jgi:hypothetical protein